MGMAQDLEVQIYFVHPSESWERDVNKNTNELTRQISPKEQTLTQVTDAELQAVRNSLNHRPRKTLGQQTPHEVFFKTTTILTLALTT
jgi:IS30 family transposase